MPNDFDVVAVAVWKVAADETAAAWLFFVDETIWLLLGRASCSRRDDAPATVGVVERLWLMIAGDCRMSPMRLISIVALWFVFGSS